MNYITSCPKCDTQFLIDDELIEAYQGDVQCGNCEHIFNTQDRLTGVSEDIHSAEEYQASLEETDDESFHEVDTNAVLDDDIKQEPKLGINESSLISDFTKEDIQPPKVKKSHPVLFSLFALLLLLTAALQTIYHLRVKIAAEYPQFKPILVKACAPLKCEVSLPRELGFITIGDSDMQEDDNYESVINFSSSFKNTANYAQTYPSIELTLTNQDDSIVIKKLIHPEDYLTKDESIAKGISGRGVTSIKLPLYVHQAEVAGYRMLLVY